MSDRLVSVDSTTFALPASVQSVLNGITDERVALNTNRVSFIEVKPTRDGSDVSDTERWQRAVDSAIALGIPEVRAAGPSYAFHARVDIKNANNIIIRGAGNRYVKMTSAAPAGTNIFSISGGFNDIVIEGFDFIGTAIEQPTSPTRGRTYGANPLKSAVYMFGDLSLAPVVASVINNFTLRKCRIYGTSNLPLWIAGVRGITRIEYCEIDNCFDPGFLYLENLQFCNNKVIRGVDNGVSVSRGCNKVLVDHNHFQNIAHWAVHVAGFLTDADNRDNPANFGPSQVIISNNIGNDLGYGGVNCEIGGRNGVIHDNLFTNILRGPVDLPSDSFGMGVYLAGLSNGAGGWSVWCENWNIHDNVFVGVAAGVVAIGGGVRQVDIHHNVARNIGTAFKADGTTAITSADLGWNYGVINNGGSGNSDIHVSHNDFTDLRATPYFNAPIRNLSAGARCYSSGNRAIGNRVTLTEAIAPVNSSYTYSGGVLATETVNGVTVTYTYNGDGSVATHTRDGVTSTYTYDGSGNLTGITVP